MKGWGGVGCVMKGWGGVHYEGVGWGVSWKRGLSWRGGVCCEGVGGWGPS